MGPHVKSGAVRVLATFAPRRLATHPEVPTMAELGYPELEFSGWLGVVAPAGTPPEVIERLGNGVGRHRCRARHEGASWAMGHGARGTWAARVQAADPQRIATVTAGWCAMARITVE